MVSIRSKYNIIKNWQRKQEKKLPPFEFDQIEVIEMDGIDHNDIPDYCDAFIADATYYGEPMTEEELDRLNFECGDFVYESLMDYIH